MTFEPFHTQFMVILEKRSSFKHDFQTLWSQRVQTHFDNAAKGISREFGVSPKPFKDTISIDNTSMFASKMDNLGMRIDFYLKS